MLSLRRSLAQITPSSLQGRKSFLCTLSQASLTTIFSHDNRQIQKDRRTRSNLSTSITSPSSCNNVTSIKPFYTSGTAFFHSSKALSSSLDDIIITKKCAQHLKGLVSKGIATEPKLRLSVESGGCSGFSYKFDVDNTSIDEEEDLVFIRDGVEVIVDDVSIEFVRGATVDYEQELIRSGFAILNNPNVDGPGCGCGVSFSVKEV
jgi:iron-sulfur cluster assembly accessory protein